MYYAHSLPTMQRRGFVTLVLFIIPEGKDYLPITEIIMFNDGEMTKTVDFQIIDDTIVESAENFFLLLTSGAGVYLSPYRRTEVIINDNGKIVFTYELHLKTFFQI